MNFLYDGEKEIGAMSGGRMVQLRTLNPYYSSETGAAIAIELNGRVFAPLHDLYGNVIRLIALDHSVSEHRYSAFGEESPANHPNPWRYASKRSDETGFIYYGRRYYSPELGRWLSSDPAGYTDGVNLYSFVRNNPLNLTDRFGLIAVIPGEEEGLIQSSSPSTPSASQPHELSAEGLTDSKKDKLLSFDFDMPAFLETAHDAFYDPHTQGAIQAMGGLCETIAGGAGALLASDDIAATIGWCVMAHGMDQFITGMKTAIYGDRFDSVTSQLLQEAGFSAQTANLIDNGISFVDTMGAAGLIRAEEAAASTFKPPALLALEGWGLPERGGALFNNRWYTEHALERMAPRGLIHDGTEMVSRGVPPSVVENALKFGSKSQGNTSNEIVHTFENVRVVTNKEGSRIITVITTGR